MNISIYQSEAVFDALRETWNELLSRSVTNTIFLTWEWHTTWWDVYCPGELFVVTFSLGDNLVGIAPWFIDSETILRTIGCEDVTDYLDLIVDKEHQDVVFETVSQVLTNYRDQFTSASFCNIPAASPALDLLVTQLKSDGFQVSVEQQDVCPVITLPESWDAYLQMLDKKQRHEVRRKLRRAHGAPNDISWYIVDETHNTEAQIDQFLALMAASDREKAMFLEDDRHVVFFRRLVPLMLSKGWLQLAFLTVDGEPTASYLNFDYDGQILVYNSGYSLDKHGSLSPGVVLLSNLIRHSIEQGYMVFDLLRGDETYKYRIGGQDTIIYKLDVT